MFFSVASITAAMIWTDDPPGPHARTAGQKIDLAVGNVPMTAPPKPKVQELSGPVKHPAEAFPERAKR